MNGDYHRIFSSPDFQTGEVFEDDPWWCPKFYEVLEARFPEARFVLITRNKDKWFESLKSHSGGRSPGETDIHARIYRREAEFEALKRSERGFRRTNWQGLQLVGHDKHYKALYQEHTNSVLKFFSTHAQDRFVHIRLEDSEKFRKLAMFLGFADKPYKDVHSNKSAQSAK